MRYPSSINKTAEESVMNEVYEHVKCRSRYGIVADDAEYQLSGDEPPLKDGELVTVYRCHETGKTYVRRKIGFHDGRFKKIWPPND